MSIQERRKRAQRLRRQRSEILSLSAHSRTYRMWAWPGKKIANCMQAGKPFEATMLEHIYKQGYTGLAIDAGANLGNHTLWLSVMCGMRVVAFEPVWHKKLAFNVSLNGMKTRVKIHPVALGDSETYAEHQGRGLLRTGLGELPVFTLDSFNLQGVSLIKVDIEGMEPAMLRGSELTIRRDRPVIFAEELGQNAHDVIASILQPWGYQAATSFKPDVPMVKWEWRDND